MVFSLLNSHSSRQTLACFALVTCCCSSHRVPRCAIACELVCQPAKPRLLNCLSTFPLSYLLQDINHPLPTLHYSNLIETFFLLAVLARAHALLSRRQTSNIYLINSRTTTDNVRTVVAIPLLAPSSHAFWRVLSCVDRANFGAGSLLTISTSTSRHNLESVGSPSRGWAGSPLEGKHSLSTRRNSWARSGAERREDMSSRSMRAVLV